MFKELNHVPHRNELPSFTTTVQCFSFNSNQNEILCNLAGQGKQSSKGIEKKTEKYKPFFWTFTGANMFMEIKVVRRMSVRVTEGELIELERR